MPSSDCARPEKTLFRGWLRTTKDVLLVFEAARKGLIPRVTRRFHDAEKRNIIQSGVVLVFTEEESGIKRWTDPFLWSASRMLGNFMIYREREDVQITSESPYTCSDIRSPKSATKDRDAELEKAIYGSWSKGHGLKTNGLMKKTISLKIDGIVHHLVSYYSPSDVLSGILQTPSSIPMLRDLEISPEVLVNVSKLRQPPHTKVDHSGKLVFVGEFDNAISTDPLYPNGGIKWIHISMSPPPSPHRSPVIEKSSPSPLIASSTSASKHCLRQDVEHRTVQKAHKPYDRYDTRRITSRHPVNHQQNTPPTQSTPVGIQSPNSPKAIYPWPYQVSPSPTSPSSSSSTTSPVSPPSSLHSPLSPSSTSYSPASSYGSLVEDVYWDHLQNYPWGVVADWDAILASSQAPSYQLSGVQASPVYPYHTVHSSNHAYAGPYTPCA